MRRILLTGAGGFVGSHLVPALRAAFPDARLIGASRGAVAEGADEAHAFDLERMEGAADLIAALRPDAVIHLAAQADVTLSFSEPLATWRLNLLGTVALGEAVLRAAPAARFVFASSGEVYGLSFQSGLPLEEDAALRPANPYAASKAAADLALQEMAQRGLRAMRLRAFNQVGPGQSPAFVVAAFARQVARIEAGLQEPVIRTGALDRWRDFLDVRDACAAYVAALRADAAGAWNICTGTPRRVGDVLAELLALAGITAELREEAGRLRPTDVTRVLASPARAAAELGWRAGIPWERTLADVLSDWRGRARDA